MTITDFLLARIAEDEETARLEDDPRQMNSPECGIDWYEFERGMGEVIRVSPARILAECEAKRRIVEAAREYSPELQYGDNGEWAFDLTLRALAAVYADHPDYDPEWALR